MVDVGGAWEEGLMEYKFCDGASESPYVDGLIVMSRPIDNLRGPVVASGHIARLLCFCFGGAAADLTPGDAEISYFGGSIGH